MMFKYKLTLLTIVKQRSDGKIRKFSWEFPIECEAEIITRGDDFKVELVRIDDMRGIR